MRRRHWINIIGTLGILFAGWAFWLEPSRLVVRAKALELNRWPSACAGLRVTVLADLHVGSPYKGLDSIPHLIDTVELTEPDLVLLAGDYIAHGLGSTKVSGADIATALKPLRAEMGVFAVLGNHDIWEGREPILNAFNGAGLRVLEDEAQLIVRGECRFWLVGMSDYQWGPKPRRDPVKDIPETDGVLLFTHTPDMFPQVPSRVALTIAGHTHGGQVRIPLTNIRPMVPSIYGDRYAYGHVKEDGKHLYVSPGIGTSLLPIRFRVPPEVTVLILNSGGAQI